ncbi:MAG: hypothetical protein WAU47_03690 [Desulfobaccales bacterium]
MLTEHRDWPDVVAGGHSCWPWVGSGHFVVLPVVVAWAQAGAAPREKHTVSAKAAIRNLEVCLEYRMR